jgi:hypothetical protein
MPKVYRQEGGREAEENTEENPVQQVGQAGVPKCSKGNQRNWGTLQQAGRKPGREGIQAT